ncbi:matrixin family metalloprotease [Rhizobium alvei]|uniref:Matrixin family metalloprotease n=1 Tax=Rhizobium alvei TaxID=1132659 RepID=A0ABT8YLJ2_9HYPH|nr:matrixin family metalloprotease [Rhizobium alvei]MDO6964557.1 matrixin family metalloprotease [Rhizobium alvei]
MATSTQGALSSNSMINGLLWNGWSWDQTSLTYFFADDHYAWTQEEKDSYANAIQSWAAVSNLSFSEVTSRAAADFVELQVNSAQMVSIYNQAGSQAFHETPDPSLWSLANSSQNSSIGSGEVNGVYSWQLGDDVAWTGNPLLAGGYALRLFVHELGHALGLKHPHDSFGGVPYFPGVTSSTDLGDNNLNHMFSTVMSYNRGYTFDSNGEVVVQNTSVIPKAGVVLWDYGYVVGPMAYDIAAIQHLYGASYTNYGDNTYLLPEANTVGEAVWRCIWDSAGVDTMRYDGSNGVIISLHAATLQNDAEGGGVLSYARNIYGGYTIANGVAIENATGGSGDDEIVGNNIANYLWGRAGADMLFGELGDDILDGGNQDAAIDTLTGGYGYDTIYGQLGDDRIYGDYQDVYDAGEDDELYGNGGKDIIQGGGGNDKIYGDDGTSESYTLGDDDDFIHGGIGDDIAYGGGEDDTIYGGHGNDSLYGGQGLDSIRGENDNDYINGGSEADLLFGGSGLDTIHGGDGADFLYGEDDSDYLSGANGVDQLHGENGSDFLNGDGGNDSLFGAAGDDTIWGGGNDDDYIEGGAGYDTIDGGLGDDDIWGDNGTLQSAGLTDNIKGGGGKDTVHGGSGTDYIYGDYSWDDGDDPDKYKLGADNDVLLGEGGSDNIYAGGGNDKIYGGDENSSGDALFGGDGNDTIYAGMGNDLINGGSGRDYMEGSLGDDTYYVDDKNDVIKEGKNQGSDVVYSDTYSFTLSDNVEMLVMTYSTVAVRAFGGDTSNSIYGNGKDNLIEGNGGTDYLIGYDGNDVLKGGAGQDYLIGGKGEDSYYVDAEDINTHHGAGYISISEFANEGTRDTIYTSTSFNLSNDQDIETIYLQTDAVNVNGNLNTNRIVGNGVANLLNGMNGNDTLSGADGNDTLNGGDDQDFLYGEDDNDVLNGGKHQDELTGGLGLDKLVGGSDGDDFIFSAIQESGKNKSTADVIVDFGGGDKIDLSDFAGKFGWCGKGDFSGNGAQVGYDKVSGGVLARIDANGDGTLDMAVFLQRLTFLDKGDFVL